MAIFPIAYGCVRLPQSHESGHWDSNILEGHYKYTKDLLLWQKAVPSRAVPLGFRPVNASPLFHHRATWKELLNPHPDKEI